MLDVSPGEGRQTMTSRRLERAILSIGLAAACLLPTYGCGAQPDGDGASARSDGRGTAIIGGVTSADGFVNVGEVVARVTETDPWIAYCSGTLIARNVFLSAGHCLAQASNIFGPGVQLGIHFDPVLTSNTSVISDGTWILHPSFVKGQGFPTPDNPKDTHDLSVFVMNRSLADETIRPARLPERGSLANLLSEEDPGETVTITTVGYGTTVKGDLDGVTEGTRKASTSSLQTVHPAWLQTLPVTGIPCQGDSGGANLLGSSGVKAHKRFAERIVATSIFFNCNKLQNIIFLYRLDTDAALDFLEPFVGHD